MAKHTHNQCYERSIGPSPSRGKHNSRSSVTTSTSSSFQSLVVSQSFSNSMSPAVSSSASDKGRNEASGTEFGLNDGAEYDIGWTQRLSRSCLCRSLSSSIRRITSLRDNEACEEGMVDELLRWDVDESPCCDGSSWEEVVLGSTGFVREFSVVTTSSTFCGSNIRLLLHLSSIYVIPIPMSGPSSISCFRWTTDLFRTDEIWQALPPLRDDQVHDLAQISRDKVNIEIRARPL